MDNVRVTPPCAEAPHNETVVDSMHPGILKEFKTLASNPEFIELDEKARTLIEQLEPGLLDEL